MHRRFAMELGITSRWSRMPPRRFTEEMMYAAHELNGPTFAHAILHLGTVAALPRATTRLESIPTGLEHEPVSRPERYIITSHSNADNLEAMTDAGDNGQRQRRQS